jgi:MFS family permease
LSLLNHKTGRSLIAFAFYFAEGVPIGFIWWAMPTLLRQSGVGINRIGTFTALLTLPWVFKFLWAPLVDLLRSSRFGFTQWIGFAQVMMCLSLLPLAFIPLEGNLVWWTVLLLLHSLCAATQDVAVDALVINVVAQKEKGLLNGYMQAGMLLGRSLFGGGALVFVSQAGLPFTIIFMILAILATMALLPFIKEPPSIHLKRDRLLNFKINFREGFRSRRTWYTLAFALTAAAGFEATGALAGPFLTDKNTSLETIGFFFGIPVVLSMLAGGFLGGFLCDRMSRKGSVALFLTGFVLMVLSVSAVDWLAGDAPDYLWIILLSGMYFFTGMFTTASYALFMDVTNPRLGATQFSTYMAATNGCESWSVWVAGGIAASCGYGLAFAAVCAVSLLSLLFLKRIPLS